MALAAAAVLALAAPLVVSTVVSAGEVLTATTAVNVRSGPGTDFQVLGVVYAGYTVEATGSASGGWTPVTFQGKAGFVSSQYLRGASGAPATQSGGATGQATTTADLNVRSGPGTGYARLATLPYGTVVTLTGTTAAGFAQIQYNGGAAWVSESWLSRSSQGSGPIEQTTPGAVTAAPTDPVPAITGHKRTVSDLNFRRGPGLDQAVISVIPSGTVVDLTGRAQNGFLEIVRQNQVGWVSAQYVTDIKPATPTAPPPPAVIGQRYATDYVNVRSAPGTQASIITVLAKGATVDITATADGNWQQIVYQGAARWVCSDYLADSPPVVEPPPAQTATPAQAQEIARLQELARGWGLDQHACLVELWTRESGWRMNAENPYSGAYGIPQALPGSKMASAGADWRTNAATQISWGLSYIARTYNTPCGAWGFFQAHNWY